ncbi:MAG: LptF/LptG family permease, partial [Pseudomonadota bacterium]
LIFYVAGLTDGRQNMQQVFIAEQPHGIEQESELWSVLTAKAGHIAQHEDTGYHYMVLNDGRRYEGRPGRRDYSEVHFSTYGRLLDETQREIPLFTRALPSLQLWASDTLKHRAELQWRMAVPLSIPILGLLALGLGQSPPRSGRYARFLPGIVLYIAYYNCLSVSRRWVESGALNPQLGLWWVNGMALLCALGLFGYHLRVHRIILSRWQRYAHT